jgi:hypothetical protein
MFRFVARIFKYICEFYIFIYMLSGQTQTSVRVEKT